MKISTLSCLKGDVLKDTEYCIGRMNIIWSSLLILWFMESQKHTGVFKYLGLLQNCSTYQWNNNIHRTPLLVCYAIIKCTKHVY